MADDNIVKFKKPAKPRAPKAPGRYPPASVAFVVCVGIYIAIRLFSPWPVGTTLRHFAAAPSCDAARAVGLAPAHIGEPGYWSFHDAHRIGVACEAD